MTTLYVIPCTFKITEKGGQVMGLAVCSDADTPETFIFPDGTPYKGKNIWSYNLKHTSPWAKFDGMEG